MGRRGGGVDVRAIERREAVAKALKMSGLVVGGVLLIVGGVYANSWIMDNSPKSVHWHPKWLVVVNDQEVALSDPGFARMGTSRAHLHQPDYKTIHFESKLEPWSLGAFLRDGKMGELSAERLVLAQGTSAPGTYVENATRKLTVFHDPPKGGDWMEAEALIGDWTPADAERILVIYGDLTPERIAAWQAKVPRAGDAQPASA